MEERYRCCGLHVKSWAYVIAVIGIILLLVYAIVQFFTGNWILAVVGLLLMVVYLLIIVAQKTRKPALYVPFLVVNVIILILLIAYIIFLVVMLIAMPDFWVNGNNYWMSGYNSFYYGNYYDDARVFTWLQLAYSVVALVLLGIFCAVISSAYKSLREEVGPV